MNTSECLICYENIKTNNCCTTEDGNLQLRNS